MKLKPGSGRLLCHLTRRWIGLIEHSLGPAWGQYVTSYPAQLSMVTPTWVGAVSIGRTLEVNRHTVVQFPSPIWIWLCSVSWCLAGGYRNGDQLEKDINAFL